MSNYIDEIKLHFQEEDKVSLLLVDEDEDSPDESIIEEAYEINVQTWKDDLKREVSLHSKFHKMDSQ